jgi:putative ABC transport system permease protein
MSGTGHGGAPAARPPRERAGWAAWRTLALMQLREQPLRTLSTVLAIALGVALGAAVYLINSAALTEFNRATRRLVGDADLVVRGAAAGFDEQLFVRLARDPAVAEASPMLELQATLAGDAGAGTDAGAEPGPPAPLQILGVDPFRAAALQPALIGALRADITRLFAADAIVLSSAAARQLHLRRGGVLQVAVGASTRALRVIDVLPEDADPGALGIMDIASAQWTLAHLGRLNRIDLRLQPGIDVQRFQARLAAAVPPGVVVQSPRIDSGRAATATRAYRVNLNMLALVALLTGAFLVFAVQSLSVLRRRVALGLLRALGVTRAQLQRALLGEGAAIGIVGSLLGLALGALIAAAVLHYLGADLGNRQLAAIGAAFRIHPAPMLGFALLGCAAAAAGAWAPAREAARRAPAMALKAGDIEPVLARLPTTTPGFVLVAVGAAVAWLPPVGGLPVAGYASIACLLFGAVLLVPQLMRTVMRALPGTGQVVIDASVAQLRGSAGSATVSLATVIVSFSLMVAMAIMVHSFRDSFDLWLVKLLPADIQLRAGADNGTASLSLLQQQRIAALPQVAQAQFRRVQQVYLRADRPAVTLIARDIRSGDAAAVLPLVRSAAPPPPGAYAAWISEAIQDQYDLQPGGWISLPLGTRRQRCFIAGVWRDYTHPGGAVVIARSTYIAATGDRSATEASIWQRPGSTAAAAEAAVRTVLGGLRGLQMISSSELRERSLRAFDRAFVITYALEAVAVLIGLAGISVAASATALTRRGQFGMLRHLGMLRRQVLGMLACEGVAQSLLAVACGLLLGAALSIILVYVINRQSFHWSIDLSVPWSQLALLSLVLVATAALTAWWSGRTAMGADVVRAVREDW